MPKDLEVILVDQPGTLADALEATGNAGVNVEGGCGFACGGEGIFHILVEDAAVARNALEAAGLEVRRERDVVLTSVENVPGGAGRVARRIARSGVNVDLVYLSNDGRLVLSGDDVAGIQSALE
jgi:hypothetical protein